MCLNIAKTQIQFFQCCADGKVWSYVPLLNFQMDGKGTLINFLSHMFSSQSFVFAQREKQKIFFDRANCLIYRLRLSPGVMFFINFQKILEYPVSKTTFLGFLCQQLISNFEVQFLIFSYQLEAEVKNGIAYKKNRIAQKCTYPFSVDMKMRCSLFTLQRKNNIYVQNLLEAPFFPVYGNAMTLYAMASTKKSNAYNIRFFSLKPQLCKAIFLSENVLLKMASV